MRHLLVLVNLIVSQVSLADTGDDHISVVPCPFSSLFSGDWSSAPHDLPLSESSRELDRDDIKGATQLLRGKHVDATKEFASLSTLDDQFTQPFYPENAEENTHERVLKRNKANKGSEAARRRKRIKSTKKNNNNGHKKKKTSKKNTSSNKQKKTNDGNKKTNKQKKTNDDNNKKSNKQSKQAEKQSKKTNKQSKKTKKTSKRGKKTSKRGKRGSGLTTSTSTRCFSNTTYASIDDDIAKLKKVIKDGVTRSHFLGGIVRLAAHDFMDFDRRDRAHPMGSDGCFDESHPTNKGLPESVWCKNCLLRRLYEERYSFLSRADFWIASANAVIRQTSEKNALDLKDTFRWGRKDRSSCRQSGSRLPEATGCREVERVFLNNMGLEWRDAVALMGAHSLGRGSAEFSGHEGTWVDTATDAQIFDKQYYEELVFNAWRPRNLGLETQDYTTGNNKRNKRQMLNTDICLVFDIEDNLQCCTKTDEFFLNGQSKCIDNTLNQCPLYPKGNPRWAATEAVVEYIGGTKGSKNNEYFYSAFSKAWEKATTNGWDNLKELTGDCESSS